MTADGYVFRVDMRLRPLGSDGPLAVSFGMLENYFITQGREWERYAWIKARVVCGDRAQELADLVRPFVFRRHLDYSAFESMAAHKEVVRANKLESCYIRPIAFYGSEKMGVSPKGATVHVAIAAWPWGAYLGPEALEKGIRVKTSSFARHHVNVSMCRAKYSGTYANSILANLEATEHGYDEGLLLDVDGFVAEGSGENLFMVKDGEIFEPELTSALIGITRRSIITLAAEMGYTVTARRITRDDLYIADEAFFTGTAAEVTPIREVDSRVIGSGKTGPITAKLQKAFFDIVNGRNDKYRDWLAPVAA